MGEWGNKWEGKKSRRDTWYQERTKTLAQDGDTTILHFEYLCKVPICWQARNLHKLSWRPTWESIWKKKPHLMIVEISDQKERFSLCLRKQGVSHLLHLFIGRCKETGTLCKHCVSRIPISFQLLQASHWACRFPCLPAGYTGSSKWDFPCNSWHDNVAQEVLRGRKGRSCFALRVDRECGIIQLTQLPSRARPSCRGCSVSESQAMLINLQRNLQAPRQDITIHLMPGREFC